jgi:hypothetical protein
MRRRLASAALAALLCGLPLAAPALDTAPTALIADLRPADGDLALQLQRGAAEARKRGLTAYVQFEIGRAHV